MYQLFQDPMWAISIAFIFSLMVGSFLNVIIHRLPIMMEREWQAELQQQSDLPELNLAKPASRCPHCNHQIRWYENIPLFSYLMLLRGRCSQCNNPIPLRYPFVEFLSATLVAYGIYLYGGNEIGLFFALFTWALICLIYIDIDHQLLPDRITLPLLWAGLLANSFGLFSSLESAVYGAMAGYLSLWCVYWLFKLITGKEGMGYGDFKLLAALGAWCGIGLLPLIILLSSLVGAIFGIVMTLRKGESQPIPFGPYLAIAGWIALIWGHQITDYYLQFSGL